MTAVFVCGQALQRMKDYEERLGGAGGGSTRAPGSQATPSNAAATAFTRAVTRSTQAGGSPVQAARESVHEEGAVGGRGEGSEEGESSSAMDVGSPESLSDAGVSE